MLIRPGYHHSHLQCRCPSDPPALLRPSQPSSGHQPVVVTEAWVLVKEQVLELADPLVADSVPVRVSGSPSL